MLQAAEQLDFERAAQLRDRVHELKKKLGQPWTIALAIGLVLSLSSTAIVLQTLNEKGLMKSDGGQGSFSKVFIQDTGDTVFYHVHRSCDGKGGHRPAHICAACDG